MLNKKTNDYNSPDKVDVCEALNMLFPYYFPYDFFSIMKNYNVNNRKKIIYFIHRMRKNKQKTTS